MKVKVIEQVLKIIKSFLRNQKHLELQNKNDTFNISLDPLADFIGAVSHGSLAKNIDIKGFLQLIKVIISIVFIILIVSKIVDQKPGAILTALGAVAAVLMFVFKDTLLGFVENTEHRCS